MADCPRPRAVPGHRRPQRPAGLRFFPVDSPLIGYPAAAAACFLATLIAVALRPHFDLANIIMVFLLTVVLVALCLGRGPAVLAAFLSVGAFDFFCVPPRFSFNVSDVQYLLTFTIMLAVALITGQLTAGLRYQARVAVERERRSRALYELARELSGAVTAGRIAEIGADFVTDLFQARSSLLLAGDDGALAEPLGGLSAAEIDGAAAQRVFERGDTLAETPADGTLLYLPLRAPMRLRGVLAVHWPPRQWPLQAEQRRLLDTFASLVAIAIERVHYVEVARRTTVQIESERLRNSLLSALSHDLRTPLTALMGLAEYLTLTQPPLSGEQSEIAASIRDEARRLTALVNNLLDMGRLQAGAVVLNRQWQPLEEVVGSALAAAQNLLSRHRIHVDLPPDLPLLEFDAVLLERVLCNLLENAQKYTPPGSEIRIGAQRRGAVVEIAVTDNGPGLPPGMEENIFEKFTRGRKENATPGVGLGLAICRAIVAAHAGHIRAGQAAGGGARFIFTLPVGEPPVVDEAALPPLSGTWP